MFDPEHLVSPAERWREETMGPRRETFFPDPNLPELPPMKISIDYGNDPVTGEEIMIVRHYANGVLMNAPQPSSDQ